MKKYLKMKLFTTAIVSLLMLSTGLSFVQDAQAQERVIRQLVIYTRPQATAPLEFETANLIAAEMKALGLNIKVKVTPWNQMLTKVWYERNDGWDMTGWRMTARPERLDPDEFVYNLFHSSMAEKGYNFVGYNNPEYDRLAEMQRSTVDKAKRKELILKAQEIIARDAVYNFTVNQKLNYVYNSDVFADDSIKEMAGMGIKNFWTYVDADPKGSQKDIILNSNDGISASNPFFISGVADSWVTELLWDRLMRIGLDGLPKPWAAKSVEWLSNTEVKVQLRSGMKWHDGKPVTAEDVKFSFQAPLSGEVPMYKPFVTNIKRIDINDPQTLTFHLSKPSAAFETSSLAKLNIAPKHIWEPIINDLKGKKENVESYQEKVPIGSGPFKYSHWRLSEEFVLNANNDHFHPPKVNRFIIRIIPNMETTLGMIKNGELNFLSLYSGDPQLLQQSVQTNPHLKMISSIDLGMSYFAVNHRRPPFDNVAFRRAVAAITDRDLIVDAVFKGYAVKGDSVISPALKFWKNQKLDYPSGGPEQARAILKEAGFEWDSRGRLMYPKGQKEMIKPTL